jgi:hypothetical protein
MVNRIYIRSIIIVISVLSFSSCNKETKKDEFSITHYGFFNSKGDMKFYFENKTFFENGLRFDSLFIVRNKRKEFESFETLRKENERLFYIDRNLNEHLYYIKQIDTFVILDHQGYVIKTQFIGYENLKINKNIYTNLMKFKKEVLGVDGVVTYVYFDDNFKRIREEYISGFQNYFRIDKIEYVPKMGNIP